MNDQDQDQEDATLEEWIAFTERFGDPTKESYEDLDEWTEMVIQSPQEFISDVSDEDIRLFVEQEFEYLKTLFHSDFKTP